MKKSYMVCIAIILFFVSWCSIFWWTNVTEENSANIIASGENTQTTEKESNEWIEVSTCNPTNVQKIKSWSFIIWEGKKVGWFHTWTVPVLWEISVCEGIIQGGSMEIMFSELTVWDVLATGMNQKLVDHLKSDDFFATQSFATWLFSITMIKDNTAYWDLTIKDITKSITFPIEVVKNENETFGIKANFFWIGQNEI